MGFLVDLDHAAAQRFGVITRGIGLRQNLADIGHAAVQLGDPDTDAETKHLVVPFETEAIDFIAHALNMFQCLWQRGIDKQQAELIPAQAR